MCLSANNRPKIPIYVTRNGDGEVSNHIYMVRAKCEEKAFAEKLPKREIRLVITLYYESERTQTRKHSKVDFR